MANLIQMAETMEEMGAELRALQLAQDGWIKWHGGKCPVPGKTIVEVRYRNGEKSCGTDEAAEWRWTHGSRPIDAQYDIIAYRVVQNDSSAKEIEALQAQVANLNSLCISRGRENEKLRIEVTGLRGALAAATRTKESAIAGIEYRDEEIERLRASWIAVAESADRWRNEWLLLRRESQPQPQYDAAAAKQRGIG